MKKICPMCDFSKEFEGRIDVDVPEWEYNFCPVCGALLETVYDDEVENEWAL